MSETPFTLYKGRVQGKFLGPTEEKPNRHMYYVGGKQKTGASTICGVKDKSTALVSWNREETVKHFLPMLKAGKKITERDIVAAVFASEASKTKAADLGTRIHDWCEQYIKHKLGEPGHKQMPEMPEDPNVLIGVTSFLEWEGEHKVKFLWSEKILYSLKHDYIGRGDFGAKVDGILCLCDIKTGNGIYNTVRAQTAAYAMADTEESKIKYGGRWAIRIAKETPAEYAARMELKNTIRKILGQNMREPEPYQVFEAKFLDNEKAEMKRDYDAFLAMWTVLKWDRATDFWKEKNSRL